MFDDVGGFLGVRLKIKKSFKNFMFFLVFKGFGVPTGRHIGENLTKMAILNPSGAVLGDLGYKLGCLGRSWLQVGLS